MAEITGLLDSDVYSGEQISENYNMLTERWGTWQITNIGGLSVEYVNIQNALFNGLSKTYLVLFIIFFVTALVIGKLVFPMLAKQYEEANKLLLDTALLQTNDIVKEIKVKRPGGWY